jgi:hypothetical protein
VPALAKAGVNHFFCIRSNTMAVIVMQAPGPNIAYAALPSGSTYTSDANALVVITNGSVSDQLALTLAGCVTLVPGGGGAQNLQTGTSYTLALADCGQEIVCTNAGAFTLNLPNVMPVGFFANATQGGAGTVTATALAGASTVGAHQATAGQYRQLKCVVIQNTSGTSAVWATLQVGS